MANSNITQPVIVVEHEDGTRGVELVDNTDMWVKEQLAKVVASIEDLDLYEYSVNEKIGEAVVDTDTKTVQSFDTDGHTVFPTVN